MPEGERCSGIGLLAIPLPAGGLRRPEARAQAAFVILPALRQRVQTYARLGAPPSRIRTFWRFGLKRRRVATIEWLRLFPNAGPLPQL